MMGKSLCDAKPKMRMYSITEVEIRIRSYHNIWNLHANQK